MVPRGTYGKRSFPWGWLVLGLVAGGAIYWGLPLLRGGHAPEAGAQGGAMPASVATVISKSVTPWSEYSGRIEAVSAAEIRPRVSGQIVKVHFTDGAVVKRGQPLFTIDPVPYEAEVARAKGAYASASAAARNAEQEFKRAKTLVKSKAISRAEFEMRESALTQATGALAAAKGALDAAQVNLDYAHVRAPISGKISRAEVTEGNQVDSGSGAPLLASIVTLSPIYAGFDLDEQSFLATIQGVSDEKLKEIPVQVGLSNSEGTPIAAKIHAFDNQIGMSSGTIRVRAIIPNKDGALVPGLFARVRIGTPEQLPSILINPAAVGTDQSKKFVFVINGENKVEYREIKLGIITDGLQIVTEGLKEGERIVVAGLHRLRPGMLVTPMAADMETLKPVGGEAAPAAAAAAPAAE